jgi:3-oxoacyl-[acyl-carrier protein] reductase
VPSPEQNSPSALVTGASRGIGAAIARRLAADGRPVGVNFRSDEAGAAAVVAEIDAAGGRAVALQGDVARSEDVERLFSALEERFGPVLVLVNNAGVAGHGLLASTDEEAWRATLDTNLTAAFATMRRALGGMLVARFGRIVNIGSVAGRQTTAGQTAYAAAKGGLEALTRAAAVEVGRRGITVNAVCPGLIDTGLREATGVEPDGVPARRLGSVDEVAACVAFLSSAEASYVTGATLLVDGGLSAAMAR